ncbi:MAG: hypothetical protein OEX02_06590 [Cyclobacteriaceae bacterium]|nr:hypothetical protein [Cyclobacteriaceae bacterium]
MENVTPVNYKICKFLKAKNTFGSIEGGDNPWMFAEDPNTICWCVKTGGPAGPDNRLAYPSTCRENRSCFRE